MYGESNMETYITICKIESQETQTGVCINLEWWDGEGDGREVQEGRNINRPMADSC